MGMARYLAMTSAEIREKSALLPNIAWMACHFSPYGTGLSNLPGSLPPGSLMMVDDITPIHGHDPVRIADQLRWCISSLNCRGVLLDFQRPGSPEAAALTTYLIQALPCPVGVSWHYAGDLACPVFLPPVPPSLPLAEHFAPWQGREIWLDIAPDGEEIVLTEQGANSVPLPRFDAPPAGHKDNTLHCHYSMNLSETEARFTLWRTREDLEELLAEAEKQGVTLTAGLYQERNAWT